MFRSFGLSSSVFRSFERNWPVHSEGCKSCPASCNAHGKKLEALLEAGSEVPFDLTTCLTRTVSTMKMMKDGFPLKVLLCKVSPGCTC